MIEAINHLIYVVLKYREGESIGLIYDSSFSKFINVIKSCCFQHQIPFRDIQTNYQNGYPLLAEVAACFLSPEPQIIIIGLKENIWHTNERKYAKYKKQKRLVNLLHPDYPCDSYQTDINSISFFGNQLSEILSDADCIKIISEAGTNLTAKIGRYFLENGDYSVPGSGGDFPSGEVGFGPIEGSVNGTLVYDFKVQHVGFVRADPQILFVENDKIHMMRASSEFQRLIRSHHAFQYISEISFGINPYWSEADNKSSIIEEKNLGTMHFGHGGNESYGNRKGPHFDAVILRPTVYLDDILVMKNGVFNKKYIILLE